MFEQIRLLISLIAILLALGINSVISYDEIEAGENRHFELHPQDAVDFAKLAVTDDARYGFPGDITVGYRLENEIVYTRSIAINNPTDEVKTGIITFSIPRGEFHYVSAINRPQSTGVMCDEPYMLGGSETGFKVRSQPNSQVVLDVTFAAH